MAGPIVAVKGIDAPYTFDAGTGIDAAVFGSFVNQSIWPQSGANLTFTDGVIPAVLNGYRQRWLNDDLTQEFYEVGTLGASASQRLIVTNSRASFSGEHNAAFDFRVGVALEGAAITTFIRALGPVPSGTRLHSATNFPSWNKKGDDGGVNLLTYRKADLTCEFLIAEHTAAGSAVFNGAKFTTQTLLNNVLGQAPASSNMKFKPWLADNAFDYVALKRTSGITYLTKMKKEPLGGGTFTQDESTLTFDDASLNVGGLTVVGMDAGRFILACYDNLGGPVDNYCIIILDESGLTYDVYRMPDETFTFFVNSATFTFDGSQFLSSADIGGTGQKIYPIVLSGAPPAIVNTGKNALQVKDAIGLPCYSPCRPLIIAERLLK